MVNIEERSSRKQSSLREAEYYCRFLHVRKLRSNQRHMHRLDFLTLTSKWY